MTDTLLAPVTAAERIRSLDVLRGLALLGIALMNVEYFTRPLMDTGAGIDDAGGIHRLADAFVYVFVQGKFWTLFSLLFGMGFAIMLDRARAAGRGFVPMYLRRSAGLLLIGLVHALLIWGGDILVSYAVTSLVLLLFFRDTATPRLWRWGAWLWGAVMGLLLLVSLLMFAAGDVTPDPATGAWVEAAASLREAEVAAYSAGSYAAATAVRVRYFFHVLGADVMLVPMVLGMFLVGAWFVRSGAMVDVAGHRRLFSRLAWIGGGIGLAMTAASVAIDPTPGAGADGSVEAMLASTLHMAAAPLMALALVGLVVLAVERGTGWLAVVAPAGRMALTNYIGQSVIGTLVFYGYGLGLWGQVPRAAQVVGVVAVFALQVLVSRWWLGRFRFGPLEWLWRAFTYLQWPPLRRAGPAPGGATRRA